MPESERTKQSDRERVGQEVREREQRTRGREKVLRERALAESSKRADRASKEQWQCRESS
jgi:hypothetical protein